MKTKIILETPRTYLRELTLDDFDSLSNIFQDIEVMYAWEKAFSDEEVLAWIQQNITRYSRNGYSYWAAIEKSSNTLFGVVGILAEKADEQDYTGIGYIFKKSFWHKGLAFECANACKEYAFNHLNISFLTAQIRPSNTASIKVAEKLGMSIVKEFNRFHNEKFVPYFLYGCKK